MWWQNRTLIEHFISDFLLDYLKRQGMHSANTISGGFDPDRLLRNPAECGLDSLKYIGMTTRFSQCLGICRTGLADLLLARRTLAGWADVAQRSLATNSERIGFHSSGSTGTPSMKELETWRLEREMRHFSDIIDRPCRIIATVPGHHIYGFLWTVMLPNMLGVPVMRLNPASSLPSSWSTLLEENDLIVATPDIWELIVRHDINLPQKFTGVSSTAPLPAGIAATLRQRHRAATVIEVYGSTETAGIGWRSASDAPYALLPYWTLVSSQSETVLHDTESSQRYPLNDVLAIKGPDRFTVQGRKDTVVQIGGHNINLAQVRRILTQHQDIIDADVRCAGDGLDRTLRFFLQLRSKPEALIPWCEQYNQWLGSSLGNVPPADTIVIGETLPRSAMNKVTEWQGTDYEPVIGRFRHAFAV